MPSPIRNLLFGAAFLAASLASAKTLIHAGSFIDGRTDTVRHGVTLTVEGDRLTGITDGYTTAAPGDAVIDLKNATVMPGLMDMHVHLTGESNGAASYAEGYYMNPADVALRSTTYAKKTLLAGFTTVRDLGAGDNINTALRDAIAKGWVVGPRIFSVGKALATTGGHGDPTNGLAEIYRGDPGPKEGVINSADDARKAVRQRYKDGADLIKVTGTGGVLSLAKSGMNPQLTEEEFVAIVTTAHDYGMKVAVHAHGDEGMRRAILAGVDSIEHGTYMSDATIKLMIEHGTYYVPTISAGRFVADKAKTDGYFPAVVRPKAATIGPLIQATFQRAYSAGVKIAFGTDMGVGPHGDNGKEFIYMVEAGMPPMKAIQSATLEGAKLIGVEKDLGTLEAGKIADLVAVPGDPLADIKLMTNVTFVMKAGTVYKQ
jgi:imidazolonepropionase-like amidohydrolase